MYNNIFHFDNTMRELFEYPDPSFPFVVWTGDFQHFVDHSIACHWHNEFEYDVLLSGELDYFINGQHIRLCQGDAVFINADAMHTATRADGHNNVLLFTVSFLPSLFSGGKDSTVFRRFFQPVLKSDVKGVLIEHKTKGGEGIVKLLNELYYSSENQSESYELCCLSTVARLWELTLRYTKEHKGDFISSHTAPNNAEKAKDILSYIQKHYAEDIHIDAIAGKTGISRSECFRCFQRYTSKSPIEYLTEYRLSHAANMLLATDKTVLQIAVECGFANSSYFGKRFKLKYGITPSEYRSTENSHQEL